MPGCGTPDRSIAPKVRAVRRVAAVFRTRNTGARRGRRSHRLIRLVLTSHGRTPAGFPVNSRGWSEGRATPPDSRRSAPEPRRGSPRARSSTVRRMGPPRRGGGHCGRHFRGDARASRTPAIQGPPRWGWAGGYPHKLSQRLISHEQRPTRATLPLGPWPLSLPLSFKL